MSKSRRFAKPWRRASSNASRDGGRTMGKAQVCGISEHKASPLPLLLSVPTPLPLPLPVLVLLPTLFRSPSSLPMPPLHPLTLTFPLPMLLPHLPYKPPSRYTLLVQVADKPLHAIGVVFFSSLASLAGFGEHKHTRNFPALVRSY